MSSLLKEIQVPKFSTLTENLIDTEDNINFYNIHHDKLLTFIEINV